jgi:hypothetical protein
VLSRVTYFTAPGASQSDLSGTQEHR